MEGAKGVKKEEKEKGFLSEAGKEMAVAATVTGRNEDDRHRSTAR